MISSEDVRHVTFDKAFQGYRREDVDDYLKQVAQARTTWLPRMMICRKSSSCWPSALKNTERWKTP